MWPSNLSLQDIVDFLNAVGVVIFLVGGAIDVVHKARGRKDDDDQDKS